MMTSNWNQAEVENVPLTGSIIHLVIETDASMSGSAFVFKDWATGENLSAESILASDKAKLETWHSNRLELSAMVRGLNSLFRRKTSFPSLKTVTLRSDNQVSLSYADPYAKHTKAQIEAPSMNKLGRRVRELREDLEKR